MINKKDIGEALALIASGRTQAAVNHLEALLRTERVEEFGAQQFMQAMRHAVDGPDPVLHSTLGEIVEWAERMAILDDSDLIPEIHTLLEAARSRIGATRPDYYDWEPNDAGSPPAMWDRYTAAMLALMPGKED